MNSDNCYEGELHNTMKILTVGPSLVWGIKEWVLEEVITWEILNKGWTGEEW